MKSRSLNQLLYAVTIIAAWVFLSAVAGSIRYLRPGPGFDFWTGAMPILQAAMDGPWQWSLLWEPFADAHHLVVSRLLFLLEGIFDGFRNFWLLGFAWAALLASAWIVAREVWLEKSFDNTARWICMLLITLGFGSAHHLNVLAYPFNQQWTSGLLLSLLTIHSVIKIYTDATSVKRIRHIVLAVLSTALLATTTFSLPAIILAWLMLCWLLPISRSVTISVLILLIIAFAIDIFSLNMLQTHPINTHEINNPVPFFAKALLFLSIASLRYFSSPVAEYSLFAGVALGLVALSSFVRAALYQKRMTTINPLLVLAIAYAMFVVGMALSTALGRVEPQHAINPRFRALNLPFLVLSAILFVYQIQQYETRIRTILSASLLILSLAVIMPGHVAQLYKFSDEYDLAVPGSIALVSGLTDKDAVHESRFLKFQTVDNSYMLGYRNFLKKNQQGIYATDFYKQIGLSVNINDKPGNLATGTLTALHGGGYQWKGVTGFCGADGRVAVTDVTGLVIGSGMVGRRLPDSDWKTIYEVFLPYCRSNYAASWTAFIPSNLASGQTLYAVVFDTSSPRVIASNTLGVAVGPPAP